MKNLLGTVGFALIFASMLLFGALADVAAGPMIAVIVGIPLLIIGVAVLIIALVIRAVRKKRGRKNAAPGEPRDGA